MNVRVKTDDKKVEFVHDNSGRRRIRKQYNWNGTSWDLEKEERFVWNKWDKVAVLDSSNTVQKRMVWGLDIAGSMEESGGIGGLLAVNAGSDSYFPAYDGNGNVTAYLDSADNITATFEYKPFGGFTLKDDSLNLAEIASFSTKPYDLVLDATMYELRILKDGRWLSRDPIAERGGMNLYTLVENNPVNNWDKLGLMSDRNLALKIMLHYVTGRGTQFTQGSKVVKRQYGVRGLILVKLSKFSRKIANELKESGKEEKRGKINWTLVDLGGDIRANDSNWLLHTLNGATGFRVKGSYRAKKDKLTCKVKIKYRNKYTFIDRADLHVFHNNKLLFPDCLIIMLNHTISLWDYTTFGLFYLKLINQEFDINISWAARTEYYNSTIKGWPSK